MTTRRRTALALGALLPLALAIPLAATGSAHPANLTPAPTVSGGDNGRIAFSTGFLLPNPDLGGHSQVFTVNPNGSNVRKLTHAPAGSQAGDPGISPDGTRIAYESNVSGDFAIWVMRANGSGKHRIIGAPGVDFFHPRWSPNGSHIVVSRCVRLLGRDAYCHIVVIRANGTGLHTIVGGHRVNANPEYSPDGKSIVFNSDRAGYVSAIWVVSSAGGHLKRLTSPTLEAFWPNWSPNGNHIVFTDNFDRLRSEVYVMRADGSHIRQLTHFSGGNQGGFATYSPDGSRIVLISDENYPPFGPRNDLQTMRADGSGLTSIVDSHPHVTFSDWGVKPEPSNRGAS